MGENRRKMADFKNHRIFSLRCLSEDVIPVSIRLKSNIKTPKGQYIIRRAEKALLNERIQSINNTIYMFNCQLDTCKTDLDYIITEEDLKECQNFINTRREARHHKTMDRQIKKLDWLCHRNSSKRGATQTHMVTIHVQQQKMQAFLHYTTIPIPSGLSTSLANP